ncbi:hypothetical protein JOJ87_001444 [Rhodococcus ruber]|uniref:hypothetical protein n=1 Tax=Rhodococcus ruber TaxID=1830 RepID=UPI001AE95F66|nr:hypothetical protein [Rhodococcus ruber]MBP2211100.1 hypothetical protein [Rhodococcus ruber]
MSESKRRYTDDEIRDLWREVNQLISAISLIFGEAGFVRTEDGYPAFSPLALEWIEAQPDLIRHS